MKKNIRLARVSALVILVFIIAAVVWYHMPLHRHMEVTMYDDEGNASVMQMELTVCRSVFSIPKPQIHGYVDFDGKRYESIPYFEKNRAYYFVDVRQADSGGTVVDMLANALWFPVLDYDFAPHGASAYTESFLFMLQTRDEESVNWRSYIQD